MSNFVNSSPFLRTSREYPSEAQELTQELSKSYIDVAGAVNERVIGIYPAHKIAISGKTYFFTSQKQQGLQKLFSFTSTADINLSFKLSSIFSIIQMYGTYTDGTSVYGLIPATSVAIAGQISFYLTPNTATTDKIVFVTGAGAPALTKGVIIIEWASNS